MKRIFTPSILSLLIIFFNLELSGQAGFVENKGQVVDQFGVPNSDALFVLPLAGMNVVIYEDGFSYNVFQSKEGYVPASEVIRTNTFIDAKQLKEDAKVDVYRVDMKFLNSSVPNVRSVGKQQGVKNYFTTGTPEGGVTGVNTFDKVFIEGIYPGVDIEFVYSKTKGFEYNFIISAEGNYQDIKMKYFGLSGLALDNSLLKMKIKEGVELEERIPASWIKQSKEPLAFNYHLQNDVVSFCTDSDISHRSIVIDPTPNLVYATYFGGEGYDAVYDAAIDNYGNILIAGTTSSNDNIATSGAFQTTLQGLFNVFLSNISESQVVNWSTYYGGASEDYAFSVFPFDDGIYISGTTSSSNAISTTGVFQENLSSFSAAFISKFSFQGELLIGTYFGLGSESFLELKNLGTDQLIACGRSQASSLPFSDNGHQTTNAGLADGIIAVFDIELQPTYSSFIGGSGIDVLTSISIDQLGKIFIAGSTTSIDLEVTGNSIQSSNAGSLDLMIVQLNSILELDLLTYFGSGGDETDCQLHNYDNELYLFCTALQSNLFVSSLAEQQEVYGSSDIYMAKFNEDFDIDFGGYLGGNSAEVLSDIIVFSDGVFILGRTLSNIGIATSNAPFFDFHSNPENIVRDIFVSKLNINFQREWGTYFGDFSIDTGSKLIITDGVLTVVGYSNSTSELLPEYQAPFATPSAFQFEHAGGQDGFIARFDAVTGVRELGLDDISWNIFPNPSSSQINVELPKGERNWQLDFYDIQGRNVLQKSVLADFITIDISPLPTGVYTLKARNENLSLSMKVLKR
jgi:hypothetical protein